MLVKARANLELVGKTLKLFLEEMERIFGIAEKESRTLSEYKEAVTQE